MKDRVVQFPHRYQLIPVAGEEGTYDIVAKPGAITEAGTPINKATLLSDETADLYCLTGDDATVDNALKKALSLSSYMAFCGNVNSDMLDAAFGKGNEDRMIGLGRQLAMYAWFKGDSRTIYPFTNLLTCDTLQDIFNNYQSLEEVVESNHLTNLFLNTPYVLDNYMISFAIALGGLNPLLYNYTSWDEVCSDGTTFEAVANNEISFEMLAKTIDGREAMYSNYIITESILANSNVALEYMNLNSKTYTQNAVPRTTIVVFEGQGFLLSSNLVGGPIINTYYTDGTQVEGGPIINKFITKQTIYFPLNFTDVIKVTSKIFEI